DTVMDDVSKQGRIIADMDADVDVTLKDISKDVAVDVEFKESADDDEVEPAELQEVVEVVTTAKLIIEVVTAASAIITTATPILTTVASPTLTTAPSAARRRNKVRLKRVGTSQRVDTSEDTIMDDVSKQGRIIASIDADEDVTQKDVADIAKE
nr:hypothetical protein [Tanacetum cinerariifolium]